MTAAGDLNRRLVLQAPVESADGEGGVTRSYATTTTLWAQVVPVSAHADVVADSLGTALRYRIVIRKRPDVTPRHQFQDGAVTYHIISVRESADRRFLWIEAQTII